MPVQIVEIKNFLRIAQRSDASQARIKKSRSKGPNGKTQTKIRIRCSRYLYSITLDDPEKAEKLEQSLPPNLNIFKVDKAKKK